MWLAQLVNVNLGAYIYSYQANIIQPLGPGTWITGYSKSKDTRLQQTYHCWDVLLLPLVGGTSPNSLQGASSYLSRRSAANPQSSHHQCKITPNPNVRLLLLNGLHQCLVV